MTLVNSDMEIKTFAAAPNIAIVKYWGKRDAGKLNLPLNSSISLTMDSKDLHALTSIAVSSSFEKDRMWLNSKEVSVEEGRVATVIAELRCRAKRNANVRLHIVSRNNFPTAAGLASSAAGYAALVTTLSALTVIARMGSGSACRSLYGGLVRWDCGSNADGRQKKVSSTEALRSGQTGIAAKRISELESAFSDNNFSLFADIAMRDSNNFHSICMDSFPPIYYMNDNSRKVQNVVHSINKIAGSNIVAYTFDAGPNAVIFTEKCNTKRVMNAMMYFFPLPDDKKCKTKFDENFENNFDMVTLENLVGFGPQCNSLREVIYTRVGGPPKASDECLIDISSGLPKSII
eukprot:GSMAST32.ASY1.ANO1.2530.1 assembled CDS